MTSWTALNLNIKLATIAHRCNSLRSPTALQQQLAFRALAKHWPRHASTIRALQGLLGVGRAAGLLIAHIRSRAVHHCA
eukprot:scaffold182561_cov36-Tisochrysis_lutea.AAC.6